jgi:uncharacterized protein YoxC
MNGTQILLAIMIVLLGVTLVIVGIQVFFVLKDLRKNLEKTNRILTDVEQITARAVVEQQYLDEILLVIRGVMHSVNGVGQSLTSANKVLGPGSVGLAMFQAVSRVMKRRETTGDRYYDER